MSLIQYGARLDAVRLTQTIEHIFTTNLRRQEAGEPGVPICIWGTHGLGKTESIKAFAKQRGWKFAYCAPVRQIAWISVKNASSCSSSIDPDVSIATSSA
jgi:hypothetical protein